MLTIGITGGSGFIGRHLADLLVSKGHKVVVFSRATGQKAEGPVTRAHWDPDKKYIDTHALKDLDAMVSLAGAAIADKRLTEKRKKEIVDSRVNSTAFLLSALREHAPNCKTLVAASATGFYGPDHGGAPFTETAPAYNDFLGDTCRQWEDASQKASAFLRTVIIRIGIVLGREGGAYPRLAGPLAFGIMPILGNGRQIVSWIAVTDLARLFAFALEHEALSGIYNGVAPHPVSHRELMHTIAKAKGGIAIPAPAPAFVLRLALGEMADEVLKSCTVSSEKTRSAGFRFDHADIISTVKSIES